MYAGVYVFNLIPLLYFSVTSYRLAMKYWWCIFKVVCMWMFQSPFVFFGLCSSISFPKKLESFCRIITWRVEFASSENKKTGLKKCLTFQLLLSIYPIVWCVKFSGFSCTHRLGAPTCKCSRNKGKSWAVQHWVHGRELQAKPIPFPALVWHFEIHFCKLPTSVHLLLTSENNCLLAQLLDVPPITIKIRSTCAVTPGYALDQV